MNNSRRYETIDRDFARFIKDVGVTVLPDNISHEAWLSRVERLAQERLAATEVVYHLSPFDLRRIESIKEKGLLGNMPAVGLNFRGDIETPSPAIFFFVEKKWAGEVAYSILLDRFSLFEINKLAFDPKLISWDNVGEFCASVSFYALQNSVEPQFIRHVGNYEIVVPTGKQSTSLVAAIQKPRVLYKPLIK